MRRWTRLNNTLLLFFAVLFALCLTGGYYADGICIWLSFLTLLVWPILAVNLLLLVIQLFTKKKWKSTVPLLAILLHADYLSAVYQPSCWHKPAASEQAGTPLTVVTYNASHFYWDRKYTMNEAAAYIKQLQPDIICFQEAPGDGYYHRDSIRYAFDYVLYKYISRRTDHLPTTIYSRYPIHSVKALYYKNSSNMSNSRGKNKQPIHPRDQQPLRDNKRQCLSRYHYRSRQELESPCKSSQRFGIENEK